MAYVTQVQVETKIPALVLNDALDDNGDGLADSGKLDEIIALASQEVDGYLAGLFDVPFADPAPAKVATAAFVFTCEAIYQRRSISDEKNPFAKTAAWWREHLQRVGNRELPFDAATEPAFTPGASVVDDVSVDEQST